MNNITILTGTKASGKTTMLMDFCDDCNGIAGILTPVINAERVFYDISKRVFFAMEYKAVVIDDKPVAVGKYIFSNNAFEQASAIIDCAVATTIIIDEIGPLELNNKGFARTLSNLLKKDMLNLLLVVREGLVEDVVKYFGIIKADVIYNITQYKKPE